MITRRDTLLKFHLRNGTVKINGKTVKKILVEGKEFFSTDKNMAMKNLPRYTFQAGCSILMNRL